MKDAQKEHTKIEAEKAKAEVVLDSQNKNVEQLSAEMKQF